MSGADTEVWSVARLLAWTRDYFQRSGHESPRLCAEILLAHALNCPRIQLYTRHEEVPADAVRARFRELVKAAATGRPIAYLTGTKEFFSLSFEVTPDVLIPRPETEQLVERLIDLVRKSGATNPRILDLGTGSACIAVSLARHLPGARVCASDLSPAAVAVAERNAARYPLPAPIEFRTGDLFAPWTAGQTVERFDIIACNPPYVATAGAPVDRNVRDHEPGLALFAGPDGLDVIRRVVAGAPPHLVAGGHLFLEMAYDHAPAVRALLADAGWDGILTFRDGAGHERIVRARRAG